jgi:hypothetical protein
MTLDPVVEARNKRRRERRAQLREALPVIGYNEKRGQWVASDGSAVCQDHAHIQPCPYQHRRGRSAER